MIVFVKDGEPIGSDGNGNPKDFWTHTAAYGWLEANGYQKVADYRVYDAAHDYTYFHYTKNGSGPEDFAELVLTGNVN